MRYGMLSGKYDSTKQRAVLLKGDGLRNYRCYNSTIRLEMLLVGGIVLTDSQYIDGLYFNWMTRDNSFSKEQSEFERFLEFIENTNPMDRKDNKRYFDVKCRITAKDPNEIDIWPKKDDIAKQIFCKSFYNSSIELKELAGYVYKISNDYNEKLEFSNTKKERIEEFEKILKDKGIYNISTIDEFEELFKKIIKIEKSSKAPIRNAESSLKDYIQNMGQDIKNLYGNYIKEELDYYFENLEKLFDFGEQIGFGRWGYYDYSKTEWVESYEIKKVLEQKMFNSDDTYRVYMLKIIDTCKKELNNPLANKYFERLRSSVETDMPIRSDIVKYKDEIMKLTELLQDKTSKNLLENKMNEFLCIVNDRYNKAFALQHGCKFVDVCDYNEHINEILDFESIEKKSILLRENTVKYLGIMSWSDFGKILKDDDIKKEQQNWLKNYDEYTEGKIDEMKIHTVLNNYIECIEIKVENMYNNRVKNDNKSLKDGPWNCKATHDYTVYEEIIKDKRDYSFIGGGSFNANFDGNEICIYCPNNNVSENNRKTGIVFRIRTTEPNDDNQYDTMIAPVENIFNGGFIND